MVKNSFYGTPEQFESRLFAAEFMLEAIKSSKPLIVPKNVEWSDLFDLIVYHRLGYVLENKIKNIPDIYARRFFLMDKIIEQKNREYESLLGKIREKFSERNIDFLPIKGITKLKFSDHKRPMVDVDLWVSKKNLPAAKQILKEMNLRENKKVEDSNAEVSMSRNGLVVECKDIKEHINIDLCKFKKSNLQKELLFCFEASHALINHPYERMCWFYDGYILMKNEKLFLKKILAAAELSKTTKVVKTYILILHNIFDIKIDDRQFSDGDKSNATLFFNLHNPLIPLDFTDFQVLKTFIQVSNSRNFRKLSYLAKGFIKNRTIIGSRKERRKYFLAMLKHPFLPRIWQFYFFPKLFLKWLEKKASLQKYDINKDESNLNSLPFYLWYTEGIVVRNEDLLEIVRLSCFLDVKSSKHSVAKIIEKHSVDALRISAEQSNLRWLIDAWLGELKFVNDRQTKKWKSVLGYNLQSKKEIYALHFKRMILSTRSLRKRMRYFARAMFPSYKFSNVKTKRQLLKEWASHAKSLGLWLTLTKAIFTFPK